MNPQSETWLLLNSDPGTADFNMASDEALLEFASLSGKPVLRFYGWTGRAASFPVLAVTHDSIAVAWSEESEAVARKAEAEAKNAKDPKAPKGLEAIGQAQVLVRRGILR